MTDEASKRLQAIFRGLSAVAVVGQARDAIGEALNAIGEAHKLSELTAGQRSALERVRWPLQLWYAELSALPYNTNYAAQFKARQGVIRSAYIEIAGIGGVIAARRTISFGEELAKAAGNLAEGAGKILGGAAKIVGETAGNVAGGLLSGLGPVIIIVLALVVYTAYFRKVAT